MLQSASIQHDVCYHRRGLNGRRQLPVAKDLHVVIPDRLKEWQTFLKSFILAGYSRVRLNPLSDINRFRKITWSSPSE